MSLVNLARDMIADAIIGGSSYTKLNSANAHIGVGSSSTAHAAAQTDLQGASKTRKAMDTGYPTRTANVVTFRSTFAEADGNHAWSEYGLFNASSAGQMLLRGVTTALGTKTSNVKWRITMEVTFTLG